MSKASHQPLPGFEDLAAAATKKPKKTSRFRVQSPLDGDADAFERAYESLQDLASQNDLIAGRNEATTRLQIIDRVLFDCLGWSRAQCTAEEAHGGEYADYVLSCPWRIAIVEAKREGIYFELPVQRGTASLRDLAPLLRACPELKAAAQQVAAYSQSRGVPIAIVTNGTQWVCFIGSRTDGTPPLEGKALVYNSLDRFADNFTQAWNCLSPSGIASNGLFNLLLGANSSAPPPKVSTKLLSFPGYKERNPIQADLEIVADVVFNDIITSSDLEARFLEECYCKSGALSQHSNLTRAILEARYAQIFIDDQPKPPVINAIDRKGKISADLIAEGLSKRPIVLVGGVGAGKTTFLRKLICVDSKDVFENSITLYVDLGRSATLSSSIREAVLHEIPEQLSKVAGFDCFTNENVRGIYHRRLNAFGRGINSELKTLDPPEFKRREISFLNDLMADKANHIREAISHAVRGQRKQVILILDNCDQRDEDSQQQAFLISMEIAASWDCMVFVTLRPETFNRSRRKGALTGYHPKVYTISPPRTDQMLDKRLAFAMKICRGEIQMDTISLNAQFTKLLTFLGVVRASFNSNQNLARIIDNLAAGNMRLALRLVQSFISSGHIDSQKILNILHETGSYTIPVHEFLRAIIYDDHVYYNPEASPLINIFQQWTNDDREWMLIPKILTTIIKFGESVGAADGFVDYSKIVEALQRYGYNPMQISIAVHFSLSTKLIEAVGRLIPEVNSHLYPGLRITSFGKCHIATLSKTFVYVDAISTDLRLKTSSLFTQILEASGLGERITKVKSIIQLLDPLAAQIDKNESSADWEEIKTGLEADIKRIEFNISSARRAPRH